MTQDRFKFRAWDRHNKVWLNLWQILIADDGSVMALKDLQGEQYGNHQIDLVYSIGLRDKDGILIYEGDIVKWMGKNGEVVWDDSASFMIRGHLGFFYGREGQQFSWDETEVIGNIYENPELIK